MERKTKRPKTKMIWTRVPRGACEQLTALCVKTGRTLQVELSFAVKDYLDNFPDVVCVPEELGGSIYDQPALRFRLSVTDWTKLKAEIKKYRRKIGVEIGLAILAHVAHGPRPLPPRLPI